MGHPDVPSRGSVNDIFGDSLPSTTRDERSEEFPEGELEREMWLRENVPPHHA